MSENAKVVALLLLLLLALGVVGDMDYQDALRSEQRDLSVYLWLHRSATAVTSPAQEPLTADDAANNDCLNLGNLKTTDDPAACDGSQPGR
jgi:hypothetical protein